MKACKQWACFSPADVLRIEFSTNLQCFYQDANVIRSGWMEFVCVCVLCVCVYNKTTAIAAQHTVNNWFAVYFPRWCTVNASGCASRLVLLNLCHHIFSGGLALPQIFFTWIALFRQFWDFTLSIRYTLEKERVLFHFVSHLTSAHLFHYIPMSCDFRCSFIKRMNRCNFHSTFAYHQNTHILLKVNIMFNVQSAQIS